MDTQTAIRARRAVKHFNPDHQMTQAEEELLFDLALQAPTAFNLQHWRFVVLRDQQLREQVREAAWGQSQVTDASLLVVLCADLKAWEKEPQRYWQSAPEEVQNFMLPAIKEYYDGKDQVQRDEAMRSCGIVAQTLMLAAQSMGYDSCPMDGFDFNQVGQLINLPDDHLIAMFVAIGKGTKAAWPKPGQLSVEEVTVTDRFS